MRQNDDAMLLAAQALSEPVRLRILRLLPVGHRCEEMYNVSELADELGVSQPVVSRHLAVLKRAGLVTSERICQGVYYAIDARHAREALAAFRSTLRGSTQTPLQHGHAKGAKP